MSMKTLLRSIMLLVSAALVTTALATSPPASFGQLVDNLDKRKNTKLHSKEYWKNVKGTEVTWNGEVVDVDSSGSKAKIYVADKSRPLYKGYNIVVVTGDVAKASTVKKGQKLRFKGLLYDYDQKDAGAVVEIKEATIL